LELNQLYEKGCRGEVMIYFKRLIKWGNITVAIDINAQITGLWFDGQRYFPDIPEDACWIEEVTENEKIEFVGTTNALQKIIEVIREFDIQMKKYENNKKQAFDLPLAPSGSRFRQLVWKELLKIPMGSTTTYGELGSKVAILMDKKTMSAQAIGGAVGHNPISLIIPCHRVVGAKGQLTGYAGGIDKKAAILTHEGAKV
jgi:methylated-DNA-[protein]-cysteine S-methyltransferase